ncbi:unnamed protein product, partial [Hapterophycus canaliculatus]
MFESDNKASSGQLLVGTIVQIDNSWKLIDLPVLAEPGEPMAQSGGNFFTPGGTSSASVNGSSGVDSKTQELVAGLESIDSKLAQATSAKDVAALNERRADVVERLVSAASTPEERDTWTRQLVDTVSVAVQSGAYPEGLTRLQTLAKTLARGKGTQNES